MELTRDADPDDPSFSFGAKLDTSDSIASLDNVGVLSDGETTTSMVTSTSSAGEAAKDSHVPAPSATWENFDGTSPPGEARKVSNGAATTATDAEVTTPSEKQGELVLVITLVELA